MFTKLLPAMAVADWCKMLRHQLGAGISPTKTLTTLAASGPRPLREVSGRLADRARGGTSFGDSLEPERERFPELVVPMIHVGDETGQLPEVLDELEDYLREEHRLSKEFAAQTLMPKIQLFAAIFIVAGLIAILGMIASSRGGQPLTVFGLSGERGALIFLAATLGPIAAFWLFSKWMMSSVAGRARLRGIGARLPIIGPCLFSLMMSRFALALQLTLNSSLTLAKALRLSFDAAGDSTLLASSEAAIAAVKKGKSLHLALAKCPRLPGEFLDMVAVAEEGGTVAEMMKHQAKYYRDLSRDRLAVFAKAASFGVWLIVAIFIIVNIFRIASIYLNALGI